MLMLSQQRALAALVVVSLAMLGIQLAGAIEIERACTHADRHFLTARNCERCCAQEGYNSSFFLDDKCRCLVPSKERKRQEAALKAASSERACAHLSGPSYEQVEGVHREIACEHCCREHSFRTSTFKIDHNFAAGVGASARGTGARAVSSECLCEGLTLHFEAPEE